MSSTYEKRAQSEFTKADREIARTADRITDEVKALFARLPLHHVARDYVAGRLGDEIIRHNPELLDWLNGLDGYCSRGDASVRLAEALADWRDDFPAR